MSQDLQWLLLRKYNSFMLKTVPEGPVFSREPGNLRNLHSPKYSGLANGKTIDITQSEGQIIVKTRKDDEPIHSHKKAYKTEPIRRRSGPRRTAGVIAKKMGTGYRPDLREAALARASALLASQKEVKPSPEKKVRGKKADKPKAIEA